MLTPEGSQRRATTPQTFSWSLWSVSHASQPDYQAHVLRQRSECSPRLPPVISEKILGSLPRWRGHQMLLSEPLPFLLSLIPPACCRGSSLLFPCR